MTLPDISFNSCLISPYHTALTAWPLVLSPPSTLMARSRLVLSPLQPDGTVLSPQGVRLGFGSNKGGINGWSQWSGKDPRPNHGALRLVVSHCGVYTVTVGEYLNSVKLASCLLFISLA
ncbi:hypothetical protein ElyMa_003843900 [Elysia marginata]|uniref:Uncharacterized protein n=1 Tax=Elysia marginata TaxID=1093978 RepID=A0AAV4FGX4_9GAST|nr:hypothetical protein ElyMa_003843900 [Elysia marginata]